MANEIISEIRLELDKFRSDLKEAVESAKDAGKKGGKNLGDNVEDGLNRAFGGLKTQFLALGASIAGAFTLKESIHAAIEQQNAIHALNSAMALSGTFTQSASQGFLDFSTALSRASIYGDEVIQKGGALLVTLGKLSGSGLERATQASLDFASALGIDVDTAFNIVGKAAAGNVGALQRYGIEVHKTGDDARDFERALEQLEARFGGLAKLQTGTFSGAMAQAKNAFGEILEELGNIIIKSPMVISITHKITDAFFTLAKSIENFAAGRDLIQEASQALLEFGETLITYVVAPAELAFNLLRTGFDGLRTIIQTFVAGFAQAVSAVTGLLSGFGGKFAEIDSAVKMFKDSSVATLDEFAAKTAESANKVFNFDASAKAGEYLANMQAFVDTVKPVTETNFAGIAEAARKSMEPPLISGWEFIVNGFNQAFGRVELTSERFRATLQNKLNSAFTMFRDGFANSFASIGEALITGEDAFKSFAKSLIGVFGDLAIQIGQFYFLLGLATLFVNPAAAAGQIAGGLALIVLGGALKALAGGKAQGGFFSTPQKGGANTPEAGGGVLSGGGSGFSPVEDNGQNFQTAQRGSVGNRVEVNIQGNVFDRRETGLQIAEVLNEAFGSNGVSLATGGA